MYNVIVSGLGTVFSCNDEGMALMVCAQWVREATSNPTSAAYDEWVTIRSDLAIG